MAGLPPLSERGLYTPFGGIPPSLPERDPKDIRGLEGHPYYFMNGFDFIHHDENEPKPFEFEDRGFEFVVRRECPLGRFVLGPHYLDSKREFTQFRRADALSFDMDPVEDRDEPGTWRLRAAYEFKYGKTVESSKKIVGLPGFLERFEEFEAMVRADLRDILPRRLQLPQRLKVGEIADLSFYIVLPRPRDGMIITLPVEIPFRNFGYLYLPTAA